jgi:hypothetical protein
MGIFRKAFIAEARVYDDPENPSASPFDVALPATVIEAVTDGETGEPLGSFLVRRQVVTIPASLWTTVDGATTATVAVPGITADTDFEIEGATAAQYPVEVAAGLGDTDIIAGNGTIAITAVGVVPTVEIKAIVTIYGGTGG